MNLKKAMFWRTPHPSTPLAEAVDPSGRLAQSGDSAAEPSVADEAAARTKVTPLGPRLAARSGEREEFSLPPAQPDRVKGLMDSAELAAFFSAPQFNYGRHHGSHYRTLEALESGLEAVVSEFQNIVAEMAERRQAKLNKLSIARLQVGRLSDSMVSQLELAGRQVEREIDVLREQSELAGQRKGWVLDALNRYRLGFDRGVREAIEFDLLNI
jgi:hypothetical protein